MKSPLFVLLALALVCVGCTQTNDPVVSAPTGWVQQKSGISQDIVDVCFADALNGWAVCRFDTILRTTNAGNTWTPYRYGFSGSSGLSLTSVSFTDHYNGWGAGRDGVILHTTDGGLDWASNFYANTGYPPTPLTSIFFIDRNRGWLTVGQGGLIFRTVDAGITWLESRVDSSANDQLTSVMFISGSTGWAVGSLGSSIAAPLKDGAGIIAGTTDGGQSWRTTTIEDVDGFDRVFFIDSLNGWVAGGGGAIFRTQNAGGTWERCQTGTTATVLSLFFVDRNNGWAVIDQPLENKSDQENSYHMILETTDGGAHWSFQSPSATLAGRTILFDVFFVDRDNGWAVGTNGTIWHTTSGGRAL